MKCLSDLLPVAALFLLCGHLDAQTFQNPQRIASRQDPISVFTVDVNGDGIPDLIYETEGDSTTSSSVNVVFGQASGGYITGPILNLPQYVGGCRPLDANHDGKVDLVCLDWVDTFDMSIVTFLGNGDGTFQTPIYSATMQSCTGCGNGFIGWIFTPADLTGNGVPDLLVGDALDGWIFVLLGDGTGKFTVKSVLGGYPTGGISGWGADAGMSITVTDLNGDGKPDLAFSSGPTILLGNGDGTFKPPATYTGNYFSCVYHDMDGDGHPDAVCANIILGNELAILHGNADGSFNTTPIFTKSYNTSDLPEPVAILDLNGDGVADIVADSSDGLEVLLGEPGLRFADPAHYAVGFPASNGELSSQLADMNQDGRIDIVASGPNGIYISYGNADGTFKAAPSYEVAKQLGHVAVADFNGDGIPDIAATGDQSIELSLGNGDGTFKPYAALPNGGIDFSTEGSLGSAQIVHGDFRGIGKQDILAIGSPSAGAFNSYILFGNGDGTFLNPQLVPDSGVVFPTYDTMAVLDINKDGRDDVLTTDSSHIYSALSNGDGTFTGVSTSIPTNGSGMSPSFPVFADFNHDGKLDAAYGLSTSVQILKGHGDGTFDATGVNLPIPSYRGASPLTSSTALVATGDFDGDGNPDIAALVEIVPQAPPWTSQILTVAYVYYGNGDGTFSAPVLAGAFNREYAGIFAADVNKDGLSDLILQTYGSTGFLASPSGDALGLLLSKPGRAFGQEVNYTGGQYQSGLVIADLNGDGYPDLLAANSGYFPNGDHLSLPPNTVTELLNLGTLATGTLIPTTTALASSSNPAMAGTPIAFTATVSSSASGDGAPTGSVLFADQSGIKTSVPLVATGSSTASASFTTSSMGIGSDDVSATYSGDGEFSASAGEISQTVTGYPVTLTLSGAPNPVVVNQFVSYNLTVANPPGSSVAAPTGSIVFSGIVPGGTSPVVFAGPIAVTGGAADAGSTPDLIGTYTITASYSGDALHAATTMTIYEQVVAAADGAARNGEWTWMAGSSTVGSNADPSPVYGTLGTPAPGNTPGGRSDSTVWTDSSGRLWLFGGLAYPTGQKPIYFNDLWTFDVATQEWTWMSGSNTAPCPPSSFCGQPGVYGTLGAPATGNSPGGRDDAMSWIDSAGNLWLYGGNGFDVNGFFGPLNDLWKFTPATGMWTWVGGGTALRPSGQGQLPVWGTLGTPAAGNNPGGRYAATAWTDSSGFFWMFGGVGEYLASDLTYQAFNDLWRLNPATGEWTWMGGSNTPGAYCPYGSCEQPGIYGAPGIPAPANIPGSRFAAVTWTDQSGHAWLFGGGVPGDYGLDDLWEYYPSLNQWAWMGGASAIDLPGVFGTLGILASANQPGGRWGAGEWTDSNGQFWLFGGGGVDTSGNPGSSLGDLWLFDPSANQWAWMGGAATAGLANPGVYGTLGVSAPANIPGGRQNFATWTDKSGNFWLFGGYGADANGHPGYQNDVWRYGPAPLNIPAAATPTFSVPAGNYSAVQTVTISEITPGAVLYYTTDGTTPTIGSSVYSGPVTILATETLQAMAAASGYVNSAVATATYTLTLPAAATPSFSIAAGSYATAQTVAISDTTPGAVIYYTTDGTTPTASSSVYSSPIAVSTSETLQAIATATGYSTSQVASAAYTITAPYGAGEWAWIGGANILPNVFGEPGVYGTLGTPAPGNVPGARQFAVSWTDPAGNLWLFGGLGDNGRAVGFNDLWKFSPSLNEWDWVSGSSTETCSSSCGMPGVYGTMGTPAVGNVPGGRWSAATSIDANGHLWLYGGYGFDANGEIGLLNDLWEFNPSTSLWTWMGGNNTLPISGEGQPPVYGTLGAFAAANNPGGRWATASWTDSSGHFWLFGGEGYYAIGVAATFNDIWEFDPARNQWAWMGGSNTAGSNCPNGICRQSGVYGSLGVPAAGNVPGSRDFAATWTDAGGHLWLYGGSIPGIYYLHDLWEFFPSTNEWAWMGGDSKQDQPGIYGTAGTPAAGNIPGSRCCMVTWTDSSGQLWLFGGQGYDANDNPGDLNDLWQFNPSTGEWAWIDGSTSVSAISGSQPGVYGTLGVPAPGNIPGGRQDAVGWTDKNGNFWLFGGTGADANNNLGNLNDLWRYGTQTTNPVATTTTLIALPTSLSSGQTLILTATVTPASGATPTGTVTFMNGSLSLGSATLDGSGKASLALTPAVGSYSITASYGGNSTDAPSVSAPAITVTVVGTPNIATTTALAASATTLTAGQSVTLTATVTATSGSTPNGFVTFFSGTTSLGTVVLQPNGVATLALTPVAGTYSITASYASYLSWLASVSPAVTITVTGAAPNSPDIYTYAGNGTAGFKGDNGLALNAELHWPAGEGMDAAGDLYFTDIVNSRVRRVDAVTGIITTIAGNGTVGYGGDNGPALGASFSSPQGVALDKAGNIYVADEVNNRVRRIDASTGIITTIAGTGAAGSSGNGGPAVAAELFAPSGVAVDSSGDVYISNLQNNLIQKVDATTGNISIVAGTGGFGYNGDGIPATTATVWAPYGVGLDRAGNLYIMDGGNFRVRRVDATTGMITTVAGNGTNGFSGDGGPATSASIGAPAGDIVFDSAGNLYFEDTMNNRVRRVDAVTGVIATYAGTGAPTYGGDGGPANLAEIQSPNGLVFDSAGSLYISDTFNQRIRKVGAPLTSPPIAATTTVLTVSATSLSVSQSLTLTATVTPASGATPTGTVTFNNGALSLGTANLNTSGVATLTLTPAVGSYSITASYGGSAIDAASTSGPVIVNVNISPTNTTLTASPNPAPFGATATFTATVTSATVTPAGNVSFYDGPSLLATVTLTSGIATYSTSALSVGSHNITAAYSGGSGFSSSTSNVVVEVVSPADFSISASPGAQSIYTGEAASYTVTIAAGTGFTLPVALSCSQLPANTTCTFSSATVSGGSGSSTLTIRTTAPSPAATASVLSAKIGVPMLAGFFLLCIPRRFRRYRNGWSIFLALLVSAVLAAAITGCGGPGSLTGGTPVGTQTVTVTGIATNGSQTLTHATTVTLNVKSLF